ncbi:protein AUXIN RESPONSE 4-like [Tripterygium wilfordii]|uniref:protein AUXIN RESPONSE 4-like n=1 Tax=Tripterygium wilfordii TaxID=458696 RepID=UPI0018F8434A|nr:protein AUXIN RESPONSE 4-like [Tripterygium wilfordii]
MAIITEEEQEPQAINPPHKSTSPPKPKSDERPNVFAFWFYFTAIVSVITFFTVFFASLLSSDPRSWFRSLPASLRQHYSGGRTIKVQTAPGRSPIEVFTFESGLFGSDAENVLIIHGFGISSYSFGGIVQSLDSNGVRGIAIDLPGNGFSDKSTVEIEEGAASGVLGRFRDVLGIIREKGFFWAFDQMIETGQIPFEEVVTRLSRREVVRPIELGSEEIGRVLGEVIKTMGLAPLHLVLHDSSLAMVADWVRENSGLVRSVTLIDTGREPALPPWVLEMPVIRNFVLGYKFTYDRLIKLCCSKEIGGLEAEAERILLNGRDGRRSVVGMGRKMNYTFDIAEWGDSDGLRGMPIQVLWSEGWSKEWSAVGRQVAEALPRANFVSHSGGRWPQEDTADEIAQDISKFLSSLPKSVRQTEEEPIPEHIQTMLDEAKSNHDNHHHHHHHGHGSHDHHDGHAHDHGAGYMDAYGLGHRWGS